MRKANVSVRLGRIFQSSSIYPPSCQNVKRCSLLRANCCCSVAPVSPGTVPIPPEMKSAVVPSVTSPLANCPKLESVTSFLRNFSPTLRVCRPKLFEKSSESCACVTLRPCGNAKSCPPRVVNSPLPNCNVVGNACTAACGFGCENGAEYHCPETTSWFTAVPLKKCVSLICPWYSGWLLTALNTGLIGSVNVACTPLSCW